MAPSVKKGYPSCIPVWANCYACYFVIKEPIHSELTSHNTVSDKKQSGGKNSNRQVKIQTIKSKLVASFFLSWVGILQCVHFYSKVKF